MTMTIKQHASPPPMALPSKLPTGITHILTDFDDTVTTGGALLEETYTQICKTAKAGYKIIVVTGGCGGWCDHIARTWPVHAVIGEGGGFSITRTPLNKLRYAYWEDHKIQQKRQQHVRKTIEAYLHTIGSNLQLAADQAYRLVDVAIDIGQDAETPSSEIVLDILRHLHSQEINAKSSSIHINAWIGNFDKFAAAERLLSSHFHMTYADMQTAVLAVGDSPNDEPLFQNFPYSAGVANIHEHLQNFTYPPTWISQSPGGIGLADILRRLD